MSGLRGQGNLDCFNIVLGEQRSNALNKTVESYREFLNLNFSNFPTYSQQNAAFLSAIQNLTDSSGPNWLFPKNLDSVLLQWELSGLRRTIQLFPFDSTGVGCLTALEAVDSSLDLDVFIDAFPIVEPELNGKALRMERNSLTYLNGAWIDALGKCYSTDTLVVDYISTIREVGDVLPTMMAENDALLGEYLNDSIVTRLIVVERYYWVMKNAQL
jgi:hypothetical protein